MDRIPYSLGDVRDYRVSNLPESVHPTGKPWRASVQSGFKSWGFPRVLVGAGWSNPPSSLKLWQATSNTSQEGFPPRNLPPWYPPLPSLAVGVGQSLGSFTWSSNFIWQGWPLGLFGGLSPLFKDFRMPLRLEPPDWPHGVRHNPDSFPFVWHWGAKVLSTNNCVDPKIPDLPKVLEDCSKSFRSEIGTVFDDDPLRMGFSDNSFELKPESTSGTFESFSKRVGSTDVLTWEATSDDPWFSGFRGIGQLLYITRGFRDFGKAKLQGLEGFRVVFTDPGCLHRQRATLKAKGKSPTTSEQIQMFLYH